MFIDAVDREGCKERFFIEAFGRTLNDKSVYLRIEGFTPYFFVEVPRKILVLSNETFMWSGRVGLYIKEEIITPEADATLTDNSTGSSNYAATGAHRLKISAELAGRKIVSTTADDKDFLLLMTVQNNTIIGKGSVEAIDSDGRIVNAEKIIYKNRIFSPHF